MKGDTRKLVFFELYDDETGVKITRLTPLTNHCHRNYFYQKCETNDNKTLLFASDFEKNRNYYLLDLHTKIATQITEGNGDNVFGGFLSVDDKNLFYVKNNKELRKVDIAALTDTGLGADAAKGNNNSLNEEIIYTTPDDFVAYGTWTANSDCTQIIAIEILKKDWQELSSWEIFAEFFHKKPFCRMIHIDIATGKHEVLHSDNRWLGHPIYKPFDDNIICFCHEGPHDLIESRMNIYNRTDNAVFPVHKNEPGESCTHEFWQPDGERLIFVSYKKGENRREIKAFNPVTKHIEVLIRMPNCSHLMSNFNGSLLVGDGCGTPADVNDKENYEIINDEFLYVFDVKNNKTRKICKHKSSWKVLNGDRQITHPHPSFINKDKQILFSSDFEGKVAIYLADF